LNFMDQNDSSQTSPSKDNLFKDADYQEENKTLNRVKQFTFIKEQRPANI